MAMGRRFTANCQVRDKAVSEKCENLDLWQFAVKKKNQPAIIGSSYTGHPNMSNSQTSQCDTGMPR
jgi:hypothetical protein